MSKRLFLCLILFFGALLSQGQVKVVTSSFDEALAMARDEGKLLVVNCASPRG